MAPNANMMMPCPIRNNIAAAISHSNEDEYLGDGEYYVENIIDKRVMYECEVRYRVKWIGYPVYATTWENIDNLTGSLESVYTFERRLASTAGTRHSKRVKKEEEQLSPSRVAQKHEELRKSGAKVVAVVGFLKRKKQFVVMYDNHKIIALEPDHYKDLSQPEKDLCINFLSVQMYAHSADRKRAYDMVHSMPVPEKKEEEPKEEEMEKKDSYPTSSRKRTWESINQTIAPVSVIKSQFGEPEKKEEKAEDEEMQQEVPISSSSNNTNKKEEEDMEVEETIPQKEEPRCSKRQRRAPNWIKT